MDYFEKVERDGNMSPTFPETKEITMKSELLRLLADPEVETAIGNIILKAMNQVLTRDIKIESGKDNPGGPPVIKTETWNVLDFLVKMIPYQEGALRGAQADSNKARNAVLTLVPVLKTVFRELDKANKGILRLTNEGTILIDAAKSPKKT